MRAVKRLDEPQSLKINSAIWTKELLDEVKRLGDYSKVSDSYKSKYNHLFHSFINLHLYGIIYIGVVRNVIQIKGKSGIRNFQY